MRGLKQTLPIERKLMDITKDACLYTTTKQKQTSQAESDFYSYVTERVEQMGRISKTTVQITKRTMSENKIK